MTNNPKKIQLSSAYGQLGKPSFIKNIRDAIISRTFEESTLNDEYSAECIPMRLPESFMQEINLYDADSVSYGIPLCMNNSRKCQKESFSHPFE